VAVEVGAQARDPGIGEFLICNRALLALRTDLFSLAIERGERMSMILDGGSLSRGLLDCGPHPVDALKTPTLPTLFFCALPTLCVRVSVCVEWRGRVLAVATSIEID